MSKKNARLAKRKIFVEAYPSTSIKNDSLVIIKLANFDTCVLEQPISLKQEDAGEMLVKVLEVMAFHGDKTAKTILDQHFRVDDDDSDQHAKIG